jgi:hypothetical protein
MLPLTHSLSFFLPKKKEGTTKFYTRKMSFKLEKLCLLESKPSIYDNKVDIKDEYHHQLHRGFIVLL